MSGEVYRLHGGLTREAPIYSTFESSCSHNATDIAWEAHVRTPAASRDFSTAGIGQSS